MMDYVAVEKLKWRSRRSMLELDLYFDRFIQCGDFGRLSESELLQYEYLLTLDDGDLLQLFQGKEVLADGQLQRLVIKIINANFL